MTNLYYNFMNYLNYKFSYQNVFVCFCRFFSKRSRNSRETKSLFLAQIKLKPCIVGQSRKDAALAKPLDAEVILWLKDHSNRDHPEILKMHARFINRYPSGKILKQ